MTGPISAWGRGVLVHDEQGALQIKKYIHEVPGGQCSNQNSFSEID